MIRISSSVLKSIAQRSFGLNRVNKQSFAKQAKDAKGGKDAKKGGKQEKKEQAPAAEEEVVQKLNPQQKMTNYFAPLQPGLSPSEAEALQSRFTDLSQSDKEILDQLADRIAQLNTSMFYDLVFRREALGTSQAFVVGSGHLNDAEVTNAIKTLRKDV